MAVLSIKDAKRWMSGQYQQGYRYRLTIPAGDTLRCFLEHLNVSVQMTPTTEGGAVSCTVHTSLDSKDAINTTALWVPLSGETMPITRAMSFALQHDSLLRIVNNGTAALEVIIAGS
jgi:hypothetical protein